jgi:hypothetical protein
MLVLIAKEQDLPEIALRILFHHRYAVEHRSFEVELQHHAQRLGQACIHGDREIQTTKAAVFDQPGERRGRFAEFEIGVGVGIVTLRGRTERALDGGIVVE